MLYQQGKWGGVIKRAGLATSEDVVILGSAGYVMIPLDPCRPMKRKTSNESSPSLPLQACAKMFPKLVCLSVNVDCLLICRMLFAKQGMQKSMLEYALGINGYLGLRTIKAPFSAFMH